MNLQNVLLDSFLTDNLTDELEDWSSQDAFPLFESLLPVLNNSVVRQGSAQRDVLIGQLGNDTLRGDGGNDLLLGLSGNDSLFGEEDNDRIWGGLGNDLIDGGEGINVLSGGPGRDQFVLRPGNSTNTIRDYQVGVDQFRLGGGLSFSQLALAQVGNDTQIRYLSQLEVAAILKNTQAGDLSSNDFVSGDLTPTFNSLIVFGDSLSDTGNLFDLTGFFPPPPYVNGRFSNGDIWLDYFTDSLAFESDQVSNFAVGGSTTGEDNAIEPLIEGLVGADLTLPGLSNQIDSYLSSLAGSPSDPDGLYVLWAGANDLFNLPADPADVPGFIANSATNIVNAISRLAAEGADTFLVPNLPNLGLTPRGLASGNAEQIEGLTISFNTGLANALDALESILDIDIVEFDTFSNTADIIGSPESFGFTNVTDPLIQQFPSTDQGFFWWDDIHPSTATHKVLSDAFESELYAAGYLLDDDEASFLLRSGVAPERLAFAADWAEDSDLLTPLVDQRLGAHSLSSGTDMA